MKKILSLLLTFAMLLALCACGSSEDSQGGGITLKKNTPVYEPMAVVETSFGQIQLLDAAFCEKAQTTVTKNTITRTSTVNGKTEVTVEERILAAYYDAQPNNIIFAVRAMVTNTSDAAVAMNEVPITVQFLKGHLLGVIRGNNIPLQEDQNRTVHAGASQEMILAAMVPLDHYRATQNCLLEVAGTQIGFRLDSVNAYTSMGFQDEDNVPATMDALVQKLSAATGAPAAEEQSENTAPDIDVDMTACVSATNGGASHAGRAVTIEKVSIGFTDVMPNSITSSSAYKYSGQDGPELLPDSQTYAAIRFTITNQTKAEIEIPDRDDTLMMQLNYDNGYLFTTKDEAITYFQSGSEISRVSDRSRMGSIALSPLETAEMTAYIPCAKAVASNPDKPLRISFFCGAVGHECMEFVRESQYQPGPDAALEASRAVQVANLGIDFMDQLPGSITSSSSYRTSGNKEDFVLDASRVYAALRFTITNQTSQELKLSDIRGDFVVDLVYDNSYVYTTDGDAWCFMASGSQDAVFHDGASIGKVVLAPLATADVVVYIPCARDAANSAAPLAATFLTTQNGLQVLEFTLR